MSGSVIVTMMQSFHRFLSLSLSATIRLNRPFLNQWIIFFCGKLTHVTYRFYIPYLFMPWYSLVRSFACKSRVSDFTTPLSTLSQVLFNLIADILGSYWLALIFQTSHVISEVSTL